MTLASAQAVFLHVHREAHEHTGAPVLHTHLAESSPGGVTLQGPEEATTPVWLEWAAAAKQRPAAPVLALAPRAELPLLEERAGRAPVFTLRSHDPPDRSFPAPRAPPL